MEVALAVGSRSVGQRVVESLVGRVQREQPDDDEAIVEARRAAGTRVFVVERTRGNQANFRLEPGQRHVGWERKPGCRLFLQFRVEECHVSFWTSNGNFSRRDQCFHRPDTVVHGPNDSCHGPREHLPVKQEMLGAKRQSVGRR